jgi:hypothetical protein
LALIVVMHRLVVKTVGRVWVLLAQGFF